MIKGRVWGFLVIIVIVALVRGSIYPWLKKRWPFWKSFSWKPLPWASIADFYKGAWDIVKRNAWFIGIPLLLTGVDMIVVGIQGVHIIVRSQRFSDLPHSFFPPFNLPMEILHHISSTLSNIQIIWSGMTPQYFYILIVLGYYFLFIFNIKNFRHNFFPRINSNKLIAWIHYVGSVAHAISIIVFFVFLFSLGEYSTNPPFVIAIFIHPLYKIGSNIISLLAGIPFITFFAFVSLRIIRRIIRSDALSIFTPIPQTSYLGLMAFFYANRISSMLYEQTIPYSLKAWNYLTGTDWTNEKTFFSISEIPLSLFFLFVVFSAPFVVWKSAKIFKAIKNSVEFWLHHFASLLQLALPFILVDLSLRLFSSWTWNYLIPEVSIKSKRIVFFLWRVIFPCAFVSIEIFLSLALASFWFSCQGGFEGIGINGGGERGGASAERDSDPQNRLRSRPAKR